jgi:hypothetical protein
MGERGLLRCRICYRCIFSDKIKGCPAIVFLDVSAAPFRDNQCFYGAEPASSHIEKKLPGKENRARSQTIVNPVRTFSGDYGIIGCSMR